MAKIIEAKAVISAADATGSVFDKLLNKIKGVEKAANSLGSIKPPKFSGNMMEELQRLKLSEKELQGVRERRAKFMDQLKRERPKAEHFFRAQGEWVDREVAHWQKMKSNIDDAAKSHRQWSRTIATGAGAALLRGGAMAGGAYGAYRVGRAGVKAAAEGQREGARDYLAGMDETDSKRIERAALASTHRNMAIDSSTMHERLRDTAMSMRSVDGAIELTDTIAQMTTVLSSLKGKDKAVEEGRKFFSALDVLGKNLDPKEVRELADGYTKALGVEGADMDLAGVLAFAKQSRAAGGLLSNRFLMTTMPGLARDMGDAQLGTSLASALGQNIGGRATKESQAAQREMGLREGKEFKNGRLAMSDPDKYAWDVLIPAMQKKGIDTNDDLAVTKALTKIFSNRTVQDVFGKLINQRAQYQGKAEQYARAPGLGAAGSLMTRDPFVAYEALFAQLRTLASQAPIMNAAAAGLNSVSTAISNINKTIEDGKVPEDSRGGRLLAWSDDYQKRRNRGVQELNDRSHLDSLRVRQREWEQKARLDGTAEARLREFELRGGIAASENQLNMPPLFTEEERKKNEDLQGELARERNRGNYGSSRAASIPMPTSDPRRGTSSDMPPVQSLEGGKSVTVEGDVKGEVQVQLGKIEIDSSGLATMVQKVERVLAEVTGKIRTLSANSNGPGSSGRSSPDAASPGRGFGGGGM